MANRTLIFVVDDSAEMGAVIKDLLVSEGYEVESFLSAAEVLVRMGKKQPQIVLTDYKMKDIDGLMLLKKIQSDYPEVITLMMTAFGSIETAIEAMKLGAFHYLVKPFKNDELLMLINRANERVHLKSENTILRNELVKTFSVDSLIGKSQAMKSVFELIKLIASAPSHVLIQGESGSGKEMVARALHNTGTRKLKAFIPINCTAIPENLLESELFGHVKGSFTGATHDKRGLFEEANGGTIFLDEIGDLSLALQAKLLRVLQDKQVRPVGSSDFRTVDVRIIAATHRDLRQMVSEGTFREDLFYRLNVIPIRVPALRERIEDIPMLAEHFLKKHAAQNGSRPKQISNEAMALLLAHPWPGNVRELENVIERAIVLTAGDVIEKFMIVEGAVVSSEANLDALQVDKPTLEKLEERYIKLILKEVNYRKDEAARRLGVSRRTLYRKEKIYGMESEDADSSGVNHLSLPSVKNPKLVEGKHANF